MEVGLDECARGPGFGRLYASAVVLDDTFFEELELADVIIRDSKTLSEKQRSRSYDFITNYCFEYAVSYIEPWDIDKYGVTWANQMAFHNCLQQLHTELDHIYVDGNYFKPYLGINNTCIVKGDCVRTDISCASIVAKVSHDQYIKQLCETEPEHNNYGILSNKGYLTKKHMDAINKYGITKYHRKLYLRNLITRDNLQ